ncbi:MAG: hypothetical protein ABI443_09925, partial [Chthoniobacterales bacterium]
MNHFLTSLYAQPAHSRRGLTNGSALIIAMLLIAVSSVLITGWVAIITARSGMVNQMTTTTQRRIALENSKALAQEFVLERIIPSTSGAEFSYNLSDPAWGGIDVPGWASAPFLSITKADGYNHFNPGSGDGYTLDTLITLNDGTQTPPQYIYHVKSRSPLLSGILLSSQTPTLTTPRTLAIGAINVSGSAFVWTPSTSMNFTPTSYATAERVTPVTTFATSGGSTLLMSNFALPPTAANPRTGDPITSLYIGLFDAINNSNAAANSSVAKATTPILVDGSAISSNGVVCDGNGNVTITLNTQELTNVHITGGAPTPSPSPSPAPPAAPPITTLTIQGQAAVNDVAADGLPSTLIVVDQVAASSLTRITLTQNNSRRFMLAVKRDSLGSDLRVEFTTSSATWRMLLEIENTNV